MATQMHPNQSLFRYTFITSTALHRCFLCSPPPAHPYRKLRRPLLDGAASHRLDGAGAARGHEGHAAPHSHALRSGRKLGLHRLKHALLGHQLLVGLAGEALEGDARAGGHARGRLHQLHRGPVRAGGGQHHGLALHAAHGRGLQVAQHAHAPPLHLRLRDVLDQPAHHLARRVLAHVNLLHVQRVGVGVAPRLPDQPHPDVQAGHVHRAVGLGRGLGRLGCALLLLLLPARCALLLLVAAACRLLVTTLRLLGACVALGGLGARRSGRLLGLALRLAAAIPCAQALNRLIGNGGDQGRGRADGVARGGRQRVGRKRTLDEVVSEVERGRGQVELRQHLGRQ
mmetsp:Transcript_26757/g.68146  ORF Transcript_26757/g.68146 Transcript_26757/m.68146 type:complete len:342 (+) Transcript_26757:703-1728(+)